MTSITTYIAKSNDNLLGVKYCDVPVEYGISWRQYFAWAWQFEDDWVIANDWISPAEGDFTTPSNSDDFTLGPYIDKFQAIDPKSVPRIAYVKVYQKDSKCMGFDLIYWNYPGETYSFTKVAEGDDGVTATAVGMIGMSNQLNAVKISQDTVDPTCVALRFQH